MTFVSLNAVCCKFHYFVIFFNVLTFLEEKNSISTRIYRDFELFESKKNLSVDVLNSSLGYLYLPTYMLS